MQASLRMRCDTSVAGCKVCPEDKVCPDGVGPSLLAIVSIDLAVVDKVLLHTRADCGIQPRHVFQHTVPRLQRQLEPLRSGKIVGNEVREVDLKRSAVRVAEVVQIPPAQFSIQLTSRKVLYNVLTLPEGAVTLRTTAVRALNVEKGLASLPGTHQISLILTKPEREAPPGRHLSKALGHFAGLVLNLALVGLLLGLVCIDYTKSAGEVEGAGWGPQECMHVG